MEFNLVIRFIKVLVGIVIEIFVGVMRYWDRNWYMLINCLLFVNMFVYGGYLLGVELLLCGWFVRLILEFFEWFWFFFYVLLIVWKIWFVVVWVFFNMLFMSLVYLLLLLDFVVIWCNEVSRCLIDFWSDFGIGGRVLDEVGVR